MEVFDPGHKEVSYTRFQRHFPNFEAVCKAIDDAQTAKVKQMFARIPEIWNTKDSSFSAHLVCCQPNHPSTEYLLNVACRLTRFKRAFQKNRVIDSLMH